MGSAVLFSHKSPLAEQETAFNRLFNEKYSPLRRTAPSFERARRRRKGPTRHRFEAYETASTDAFVPSEYFSIRKGPPIRNGPLLAPRNILASVTDLEHYTALSAARRTNNDVSAIIDASVFYRVFFFVPEDCHQNVYAWPKQDRAPIFMQDNRRLGVRRFFGFDRAPDILSRSRFHHLSHRSALTSESRTRAPTNEGRDRRAAGPWFRGRYLLFDCFGTSFRALE